MSTPDSDKYPAHTDVEPSVVSSARHLGRADSRDMMRSTYEKPALEADIELPTSTAEQSSLVEDYQAVDWESALDDGDMSDTNSYTLNGKPYIVSQLAPAGSDHPQIVNLDFCQDFSLSHSEMGRYQPTSRDIGRGWCTRYVPVLLDTGACVPQPMLISQRGLDGICPGGVTVDPISRGNSPMTAANGTALAVVGSIDLLCRFSGPSAEVGPDGNSQLTGPPMQHWIPIQAAVVANLSTDVIMTASFIKFQQMRIIYAHLLKFDERGGHDHVSAQVGYDGRLDWDPVLHGRASQLTVAIGANLSTGP